MLRTYLFALIIGVQAVFGLNFTIGTATGQPDHLSGFDSHPVASAETVASPQVQEASNTDYFQKLKDLGITIHPGRDYASDSTDDPNTLKKCASLVYQTLRVMPDETVTKIKNLTLYSNSTGRRGLGGGSTIILRCQNVSDQELVSVLIHELGHIEDTSVLRGDYWAKDSEFMDGKASVYQNDLSLDFYRISFKNDTTLRDTATEADFVTGYAMTDPFEDFAETYNFYLLHGEAFRNMAKQNQALAKKYDFMKNSAFSGQEFFNDAQPNTVTFDSRIYDATILEYDIKKLLAYS